MPRRAPGKHGPPPDPRQISARSASNCNSPMGRSRHPISARHIYGANRPPLGPKRKREPHLKPMWVCTLRCRMQNGLAPKPLATKPLAGPAECAKCCKRAWVCDRRSVYQIGEQICHLGEQLWRIGEQLSDVANNSANNSANNFFNVFY